MRPADSIKESWIELKPVKHLMKPEEIEWFRLFLRAYYCRDAAALSKISPTVEAYNNTWNEAIWMSNEGRRLKVANTRAYGGDYTHETYIPLEHHSFNFEEAIVELIDVNRERANGKKTEAVSENQTRNSRSSKTKRGSNNKSQGSYRGSRQREARALA